MAGFRANEVLRASDTIWGAVFAIGCNLLCDQRLPPLLESLLLDA